MFKEKNTLECIIRLKFKKFLIQRMTVFTEARIVFRHKKTDVIKKDGTGCVVLVGRTQKKMYLNRVIEVKLI